MLSRFVSLAGLPAYCLLILSRLVAVAGKTECFLYPILDHCLRAKREGQKGIKAIVLHPMNALAAEQEMRFAEAVLTDDVLKAAGGIRVDSYTRRYDPANPGAGKQSGTFEMGEKNGVYHGITNHAIQMEEPSGILLTNCKMLDFLLMRHRTRNCGDTMNRESCNIWCWMSCTPTGAQGADFSRIEFLLRGRNTLRIS